uniref:Sulfhydryl oxidase n=1 Tax=Daucus carota subsp. sativus TaxID=79200 RepID=A0A166EE51_DAUCS
MNALTMFLFLLLLSFQASSSSFPLSFRSRSLLRALNAKTNITSAKTGDHDYAVDLNITDFNDVLGKTKAPFAIVEFFAHWCPACRNYKPHYEKVAKLFNGANAVHPGMILVTRVDCAEKCSYESSRLKPNGNPYLATQNSRDSLTFLLFTSFFLGIESEAFYYETIISPPFSTCLAAQINTNLCDKFSVDRFPMLFWGPPSHFASFSKKGNTTILFIDDRKTADRVLIWINKRIGSSYSVDDLRDVDEDVRADISDRKQIARALYNDTEEATYMAFDLIFEHKMIKFKTRAFFIEFLQLIAAHHPSRRCRKGSADILVNFDDLCPLDILSGKEEECMTSSGKSTIGNSQICGSEIPRGYWSFCRGSKNDTRGFSCGLWVLLHSLSVRIENRESQMAFTATCEFIHNFFICEECREHFYDMCSSVSSPFNRTRDYALWLWTAHNKVNERLMRDEASLGTGDPKFPKMFWPPKELCPSCYFVQSHKSGAYSQIRWNHDEVFNFLANYYGKRLLTEYKDEKLPGDAGRNKAVVKESGTSTHARVPWGAALAIVVAACAFGALACYWRLKQKNWKYLHHLHSLKNI